MGKTKQTDKYDRFIDYLDADIFNYQQCMLEDKQYIDLYREIKKLLGKKSRGERIVSSDYKNLSSISCPNEVVSALFFKLAENNTIDMYSPSYNCYNNDCCTCWKKYIDSLIEYINGSDASTKNFVPDIMNKKFKELETLYSKLEEEGGHKQS